MGEKLSLRPIPLKRFYLAFSKRHEGQILEEMASLNAIQLIDAKDVAAGDRTSFDVFDRFIRMAQRCSTLLSTIGALRDRFANFLPTSEYALPIGPEKSHASLRVSQSDIKETLTNYESRLDALNIEVDKLVGEIEALNMQRGRLSLLMMSNVQADALGTRTFTVVKAGLVSNKALPKLEETLATIHAVHEVNRASAAESLVSIVASKQQKEKLDNLLVTSSFQEIDLPAGLDPDPKKALSKVEDSIRQKLIDSVELERELRGIDDELATKADYVNFLRETNTVLSRTTDLCLTQGWIIENAIQDLRQRVTRITSNAYYLEIVDPKRGEETPVLLTNRGWLLKGFELLTSIRGTPSYGELDPTIIFALLFPVMYGMMFGDVGDGAVILVLGLIFYRMKKGFIGISAHAVKSLGTIMIVGGLSGMIFGVLYGSWFLTHAFHPLLFEPISSFGTIVEITLAFGVLQITISLILNIRNNIARGELGEAVFSGKGVIGLCYYLLGIVLAVRLIQGNLQLSLFVAAPNLPFTTGAVACLVLIFLSPTMRHIKIKDRSAKNDLMDGFGEFIEVFISFLTNSLSYLRLAAFAIAHSVFAQFAMGLESTLGVVTSLVLVNALVIVVDGFAAGIQSIRLLYYEFSTKFFSGSGQRFKPLTLKLTESP